MADPGRVRSWRALDDTDMAKPLLTSVTRAIARGTVIRTQIRDPAWITLRFKEGREKFYVDLPAVTGSGFHPKLNAMEIARHLIAACDDAGQEAQDIGHCTRMASIILGSIPDIDQNEQEAIYVSSLRTTGRPCTALYDPAKEMEEWVNDQADPIVIEAVGILCPLWFRPERQSNTRWRCTRVGFEEIEVLPTPADPIEIMRAVESASRDRPWKER